jgi:hypothetical protein
MIIRTDNLPWPIDPRLRNLLQHEINAAGINGNGGAVLNFRDPEYDHATGGYHPVEIAIDENGAIQYITDFALYGCAPHVELAKEIDFDFSMKVFQHFSREFPIRQGRELFDLWQENFISYYQSNVYRVDVSEWR